MESEKGSLNRIKILYAIMFLFTGAFVFGMSFILGKTEAASSRDLMESTDLRPMRLLTGSAEGRFASLLNRTVSDCILT